MQSASNNDDIIALMNEVTSLKQQRSDDLKIIDELLGLMNDYKKGSWPELESRYSITRKAIGRLREAWKNGEMVACTSSLVMHLERTEKEK